ncbi:MAG TPA: PP2C family serine/threonine-protein phosphatase [Anaerolineales bacterium]|nr:PP2C family serine/threonine-protein phosphatase [Anaerolineales bacterium]
MIRTTRAHLIVDAQTHPGMTGKNNEDRYAVASFVMDKNDKTPVLFAVLSDGIGGHRAGEVAAELAVNHMMQAVAHSDGRQIRDTIEEAVIEASDAIAAHSQSNPNLKGMGATCAAVWIVGDRLHTAYVGDSRIYLMRGGRIQQLSVDHTWVQEAIDRGMLTPDQARVHPNVHVIRRYMGSPTPPEPDFRLKLFNDEGNQNAENNQGFQLLPNDVLLLCSDGLTDLVWNDEILEVVRSKPNLKEATRTLVEMANSRGGHDNITVILISVPADYRFVPKKQVNWAPWVIGSAIGIVLLLAVGSVLALSWLRLGADADPTATPTLTPTATQTARPIATMTPFPTMTILPTLSLPIAPTYTPWPTNTRIP